LKDSLQIDLEKRVSEKAEQLIERLNTLQSLYEKYKTTPRDQLRKAKKEWKEDWKQWKQLIRAAHQVEQF
jgi:hypothetical protein